MLDGLAPEGCRGWGSVEALEWEEREGRRSLLFDENQWRVCIGAMLNGASQQHQQVSTGLDDPLPSVAVTSSHAGNEPAEAFELVFSGSQPNAFSQAAVVSSDKVPSPMQPLQQQSSPPQSPRQPAVSSSSPPLPKDPAVGSVHMLSSRHLNASAAVTDGLLPTVRDVMLSMGKMLPCTNSVDSPAVWGAGAIAVDPHLDQDVLDLLLPYATKTGATLLTSTDMPTPPATCQDDNYQPDLNLLASRVCAPPSGQPQPPVKAELLEGETLSKSVSLESPQGPEKTDGTEDTSASPCDLSFLCRGPRRPDDDDSDSSGGAMPTSSRSTGMTGPQQSSGSGCCSRPSGDSGNTKSDESSKAADTFALLSETTAFPAAVFSSKIFPGPTGPGPPNIHACGYGHPNTIPSPALPCFQSTQLLHCSSVHPGLHDSTMHPETVMTAADSDEACRPTVWQVMASMEKLPPLPVGGSSHAAVSPAPACPTATYACTHLPLNASPTPLNTPPCNLSHRTFDASFTTKLPAFQPTHPDEHALSVSSPVPGMCFALSSTLGQPEACLSWQSPLQAALCAELKGKHMPCSPRRMHQLSENSPSPPSLPIAVASPPVTTIDCSHSESTAAVQVTQTADWQNCTPHDISDVLRQPNRALFGGGNSHLFAPGLYTCNICKKKVLMHQGQQNQEMLLSEVVETAANSSCSDCGVGKHRWVEAAAQSTCLPSTLAQHMSEQAWQYLPRKVETVLHDLQHEARERVEHLQLSEWSASVNVFQLQCCEVCADHSWSQTLAEESADFFRVASCGLLERFQMVCGVMQGCEAVLWLHLMEVEVLCRVQLEESIDRTSLTTSESAVRCRLTHLRDCGLFSVLQSEAQGRSSLLQQEVCQVLTLWDAIDQMLQTIQSAKATLGDENPSLHISLASSGSEWDDPSHTSPIVNSTDARCMQSCASASLLDPENQALCSQSASVLASVLQLCKEEEKMRITILDEAVNGAQLLSHCFAGVLHANTESAKILLRSDDPSQEAAALSCHGEPDIIESQACNRAFSFVQQCIESAQVCTCTGGSVDACACDHINGASGLPASLRKVPPALVRVPNASTEPQQVIPRTMDISEVLCAVFFL